MDCDGNPSEDGGALSEKDKAAFEGAAQTAKANCPISRLLNAKISLQATVR